MYIYIYIYMYIYTYIYIYIYIYIHIDLLQGRVHELVGPEARREAGLQDLAVAIFSEFRT